MPYIKPDDRKRINDRLDNVATYLRGSSAGDLNYVISVLTRNWMPSEPKYADFNAAIGVLECAKQELYRRMVAPYEDKKREENGDVY